MELQSTSVVTSARARDESPAPSHDARDLPSGALRPDDAGYPDAVAGFNLAVAHRPPVAVVATSAEDVVSAVRYAAAQGLPVAVEATGHNRHRSFTEGVLVNTSAMDAVTIDPRARTATVGAGARWRAVMDAAGPHGLGGLCGSTSDVSVVGYTLGGGLPLLGRAFGFAADRVLALDVVTADGQLRTVSRTREPELFWALRGGGGSLGVVTSMTFELLELSHIVGGGIFYPGEHAATVLAAYARWTADLPAGMCTSLAFLRLPPLPDVPEPLRGRFVMHLRVACPGPAAEVDAFLAPMRSCAPAVIDMVGELPYAQLDSIHQDPEHPIPFMEQGRLVEELTPEVQQALLDRVGPDSGSALLLVELRQLGGALVTPAHSGDDNAIGARDAAFHLMSVGVLMAPQSAVPADLDALHAALAPHTSGRTFLNLHGAPGDEQDCARAWTPAQYARLRAAKLRFDPANVFRPEHGVLPAAS
ncbi:MAG TPA: FAD-binding oxidoreductase [Segeticoccus sp.]|uniref:FAD-binding oxidoreductase n=1 Tax=Segeticoccus sp. TaxID=2706531 RepID=UPI002D7F7259|nr:FAD-binding oxidoreductase [Segeticoccus sp.]HET8600432.1 FAD-binding oxidoreductase [Segeticoccus sp.]